MATTKNMSQTDALAVQGAKRTILRREGGIAGAPNEAPRAKCGPHTNPDRHAQNPGEPSYWTQCEVRALFDMPFLDLVMRAARVHRLNFDPGEVEIAQLISIKTGGCPENCSYCPQSAHYPSGKNRDKGMLPLEEILRQARTAKARGAKRFCMGGAWRSVPKQEKARLLEIIAQVKALGLETCGTFGMADEQDARDFKAAGLDYYNHNIDSSAEFYGSVVTTRTQQERYATLKAMRASGVKLCCGGIVGMNESREDRIALIRQLANMDPPPESVPINNLVRVKGTPLENAQPLDWTEFVRCIAAARIACPKSRVRISAGRAQMGEAAQALCFLAGANSIFCGDKLLVTDNRPKALDEELLGKLDLKAAK